MWQQIVKPYVESDKLTVIGVVQEQHPDRARLYRQWRQLDWPIFVDSLNVLDVAVVPVPVAIDESGIVRHESIRPDRFVKKFMELDYPGTPVPDDYNRAEKPDWDPLRQAAERSKTVEAWRDLGDAYFLHGGSDGLSRAIEAYEKAVTINPEDGRAQFRIGVALRRRYESTERHPGDAQAAVERWGLALSVDPNQYIWRRRIQQYGPRLDKPYNFYFWVEQARKDITARGEEPVMLAVEPSGSELAPPVGASRGVQPARAFGQPETTKPLSAQAKVRGSVNDRIQRDVKRFVQIESVVTPARVQPGNLVRVRATFRLNEKTRPFFNNEADDLAVQVNLPDGFTLGEGELTYPNPQQPETQDDRALEFEIAVDKGAKTGTVELPAYALYYVCENKGGKCRYLRQDFTVTLNIDPKAPKIR